MVTARRGLRNRRSRVHLSYGPRRPSAASLECYRESEAGISGGMLERGGRRGARRGSQAARSLGHGARGGLLLRWSMGDRDRRTPCPSAPQPRFPAKNRAHEFPEHGHRNALPRAVLSPRRRILLPALDVLHHSSDLGVAGWLQEGVKVIGHYDVPNTGSCSSHRRLKARRQRGPRMGWELIEARHHPTNGARTMAT